MPRYEPVSYPDYLQKYLAPLNNIYMELQNDMFEAGVKPFNAAMPFIRSSLSPVALAGVVVLGALNGILVAIAVSMLALLHQANHPPVYILGRKHGTEVYRPLSPEHPEDETFPGMLIARTEGRIHFANAQRVGDKLWPIVHAEKPKVIVLDSGAVPDLEFTALKMLIDAERKLRESGTELWLASLNPAALRMVRNSPLGRVLGRGRMYATLAEAVAAYQKQRENE